MRRLRFILVLFDCNRLFLVHVCCTDKMSRHFFFFEIAKFFDDLHFQLLNGLAELVALYYSRFKRTAKHRFLNLYEFSFDLLSMFIRNRHFRLIIGGHTHCFYTGFWTV